MASGQKYNSPKHLCRDCARAYDFHCKNVKGEFFMCRCPHQPHSMLMNHEGCSDNFKPKKPGQ